MSATIFFFPGNRSPIRLRPTCLADLPEGSKALVITAAGSRYHVALSPAHTADERRIRRAFTDIEDARRFARAMSIAYPRLYKLIIDDLPERHPSVDLSSDQSPSGWDGAA